MEQTYDKKKFGERLRSTLDNHSISQSAAARWLGVDQTAVSAWCRGASDITLSKAVELSRWLGVSLDWLVGTSDDPGEGFSSRDRAAALIVRLLENEGPEKVWGRLSSTLFYVAVGKDLVSVPPPDPESWSGGGAPFESTPADDGSGSNPPNNENLANFVRVMKKAEERVEAAEKKIDRRGRPRNTTGEKKRKAQ